MQAGFCPCRVALLCNIIILGDCLSVMSNSKWSHYIPSQLFQPLPPTIVPCCLLLSHLTAPNPPTNLRAVLVNETITVTWTPPALGDPADFYLITYNATSGPPDTGSLQAVASATELQINGRLNANYSVTVMALSTYISSIAVETTTVAGGEFTDRCVRWW